MTLRDQFEAWVVSYPRNKSSARVRSYPSVVGSVSEVCADEDVELAWQAFQAGHAKLRDDVNAFCVRVYNSQTKVIASDISRVDTIEWNKGYRAAMSEMIAMMESQRRENEQP